MQPETYSAAFAHFNSVAPREGCGLIVSIAGVEQFRMCENVSKNTSGDHFEIKPEDWAAAEDDGEILAVVHSHVNLPALASDADKLFCEHTGVRWYIIGVPSGAMNFIDPTGEEIPLVGRSYSYGVLDCFTILVDYYQRELGIVIPSVKYENEFWKLENGEKNLYVENYAAAGFVEVKEMREHDILLMRVQSRILNHAAIYLGGGMILHHLTNRLSSRETYSTYYRKATGLILRHRSLC